MNRNEFREHFGATGPVIFPVIHVLDVAQAVSNVRIAQSAGASGVFLINHDFGVEPFLPIIQATREAFPDFWLGLNFLAVTGRDAFPILGRLLRDGTPVDAYWADDARINELESADQQPEADQIDQVRRDSGWSGLYFGGTAFKKQREVEAVHYETSAQIGKQYMDVVTTSGVATGHAAGTDKIGAFRRGLVDQPLGLASGVTPENVGSYASQVDAILVATGVNVPDDFYNLDAARLDQLMINCSDARL